MTLKARVVHVTTLELESYDVNVGVVVLAPGLGIYKLSLERDGVTI